MSVLPEVTTDHFFNPRNVGDADEPSFAGRAASLVCGAHVRLSLQVDEEHLISQARFKAAGCDVLVASTSLLTERIVNIPTADAAIIGQDTGALRSYFADLEPEREHCPQLACDALLAAIREYSDAARGDWVGDEALICTCFFVSERAIEREIAANSLKSIADVTRACNAGGGCGSCHQLIQELLDAPNDLPR